MTMFAGKDLHERRSIGDGRRFRTRHHNNFLGRESEIQDIGEIPAPVSMSITSAGDPAVHFGE